MDNHFSKKNRPSPFGYTHPDKDDIREMDQYCKNEDTERIVDFLEKERYKKHYGHDQFKIFRCFCCKAEWAFEAR